MKSHRGVHLTGEVHLTGVGGGAIPLGGANLTAQETPPVISPSHDFPPVSFDPPPFSLRFSFVLACFFHRELLVCPI